MIYDYFEWSQPRSADPGVYGWSIEFPDWAGIEMTMCEGTAVVGWDPSLVGRYNQHGIPVDFRESVGDGWHIYSDRLRSLVDNMAPAMVQYLPFRLLSSVGRNELLCYCVANHLRIVDCLDRIRTTLWTPRWEPINPLGDFKVKDAVLSRRLIAEEILFRVRGRSGVVLVRGDLKERIESEGLTGCMFTAADVSD